MPAYRDPVMGQVGLACRAGAPSLKLLLDKVAGGTCPIRGCATPVHVERVVIEPPHPYYSYWQLSHGKVAILGWTSWDMMSDQIDSAVIEALCDWPEHADGQMV